LHSPCPATGPPPLLSFPPPVCQAPSRADGSMEGQRLSRLSCPSDFHVHPALRLSKLPSGRGLPSTAESCAMSRPMPIHARPAFHIPPEAARQMEQRLRCCPDTAD